MSAYIANEEQWLAEMTALMDRAPQWRVELPPVLWAQIIGSLQVTLSNPALTDDVRARLTELTQTLIKMFPAEYKELHRVFEAGFTREGWR